MNDLNRPAKQKPHYYNVKIKNYRSAFNPNKFETVEFFHLFKFPPTFPRVRKCAPSNTVGRA